ncbi:MAG: radical SAM protein [Anaerocolumna aminovalerica]|jgi:MoaA/NifB/PqqE/SkfB family radical SAM enzyme|uniref:Radical SAM superfamily protein n=1 Tax=Anaerocolumna aminovalerica TaxID=1527 RepID=A0A1I5EAH0_9FIRM|nr:radical SAM protein [Anaerocolumna aminovalerica]MDU6263294.1 radical SAM protein [Anaerocolumna aminovalerica]SFO08524.1 Radical SAM superfamily protein [Anaerocolumna aminovalerica]
MFNLVEVSPYHTHLTKVILYAKEKGLKTRISTSGVGLTDQMAQQLKNVRLDYCLLSLNGSKEHIHKLSRSGFDETIKALHILSDAYIPTSINWVANHGNVSDLPKLINLAKSNDVKYISLLSNKKSNSDKALILIMEEL